MVDFILMLYTYLVSGKVGVNARTDFSIRVRAKSSAFRVFWTCMAHLQRQTDPEADRNR